jgi:hypothetical protein
MVEYSEPLESERTSISNLYRWGPRINGFVP